MNKNLGKFKKSMQQAKVLVRDTVIATAKVAGETVNGVKTKPVQPSSRRTTSTMKQSQVTRRYPIYDENLLYLTTTYEQKQQDEVVVSERPTEETYGGFKFKLRDNATCHTWKHNDQFMYSREQLEYICNLSKTGTYLTLKDYDNLLDTAITSRQNHTKYAAMVVVLLKHGVIGSRAKYIRTLQVSDFEEDVLCPCNLSSKERQLAEQIISTHSPDDFIVGTFKYITDNQQQQLYLYDNILSLSVGKEKAKNLTLKNIFVSLKVEEVANNLLIKAGINDYKSLYPKDIHKIISQYFDTDVSLDAVSDVLNQLSIIQTYA